MAVQRTAILTEEDARAVVRDAVRAALAAAEAALQRRVQTLQVPLLLACGSLEDGRLSEFQLRELRNDVDAELLRRQVAREATA